MAATASHFQQSAGHRPSCHPEKAPDNVGRSYGLLNWPTGSKLNLLNPRTAMVEVLDSAEKYYAEVLKPQYDEFFHTASSFRTAFNLASSLFHFHEWLYEGHQPQLEAHFRKTLANKWEFWTIIEASDKRFGFIRDMANASKHVRLTRSPSTSMSHVANTHLHLGGFSAGFDRSAFDVTRITMRDGGADISFDECATALFGHWTKLMADLGLPTS